MLITGEVGQEKKGPEGPERDHALIALGVVLGGLYHLIPPTLLGRIQRLVGSLHQSLPGFPVLLGGHPK